MILDQNLCDSRKRQTFENQFSLVFMVDFLLYRSSQMHIAVYSIFALADLSADVKHSNECSCMDDTCRTLNPIWNVYISAAVVVYVERAYFDINIL